MVIQDIIREGGKGEGSVADPDPVFLGQPDPGKYQIRILYLQKDPCNSNMLDM